MNNKTRFEQVVPYILSILTDETTVYILNELTNNEKDVSYSNKIVELIYEEYKKVNNLDITNEKIKQDIDNKILEYRNANVDRTFENYIKGIDDLVVVRDDASNVHNSDDI